MQKQPSNILIEKQRFVCQSNNCKQMVYVFRYEGNVKYFRCATCLNLPVTNPGQMIPAGHYTYCTKCPTQFKVMRDFHGRNPKCPLCRYQQCKSCKKSDATVTFGPDPFMAEIHNNHTSVWMCDHCREQSAMDI